MDFLFAFLEKERNASMKDLQFPFPYREGQREIVSGVYHTVSSKKTLFVQAPTGVGKTMSAIFPSVRAIGEGKGETLFTLPQKPLQEQLPGKRSILCVKMD